MGVCDGAVWMSQTQMSEEEVTKGGALTDDFLQCVGMKLGRSYGN